MNEKKEDQKSGSKINDKKCCRCVSRKNKVCTNKKSPHYGKYIARKMTCGHFRYDE